MNIGLLPLLFVVFLILKLCHVIAWSWIIVCLPLLASLGLAGIYLLLVLLAQLAKD